MSLDQRDDEKKKKEEEKIEEPKEKASSKQRLKNAQMERGNAKEIQYKRQKREWRIRPTNYWNQREAENRKKLVIVCVII